MTKVAIVGPEESKWTPELKVKAIKEIELILEHYNYPVLISGHCPKGGVDIWSEIIASEIGIKKEIFPPEIEQWNDKKSFCEVCDGYVTYKGYKSRNIQITKACDVLYCITPWCCLGTIVEDDKWAYCKHCETTGHVSSGGCWTMKYAKKLGKETHLIVIQ